ncbi:E3 ubiquitin-protein ligase TRIM35-like [Entelurus aequoreus]|uniref:E3 ubiquitin-protein ligase TRIM35-like n=1 Tax=Entelurus aequoreus TaxID=161455 RepID=UPI002B1DF98D|nr:E3 ubiquitin-protein ligase TRIM35-like [Entelurus aequoreus]
MACHEALQCSSCLEVFKDPVILSCSHSFCRSCVERWWEGKKDRSCPLCRTQCRSMDLPPNLALRNVCEAFAASSVDTEEECKLHKEKLKLFCLDHQQPVCLVCKHANIHTNHRFSPIEETAKEHREDLEKVLRVLTKRLKMFTEVKEDISQQAEHIQVQKQQVESKINEIFKELHNFLEEEEEARLSLVREEEQSKSQTMKEKIEGLSSDMKALQGVIISTEKLLTADNVSFLKNYKEMRARAQKLPEEPKLVPGPVLDMDKHLDIPLTMWEKMKTLGSQSDLPVLNVTAVHSEAHTWNVDVGDNDNWELGLMSKSLRAGIRFEDGKYKRIYPECVDLPLSIQEKQQRFRVRLDIRSTVVGRKLDTASRAQFSSWRSHTFLQTIFMFDMKRVMSGRPNDLSACYSDMFMLVRTL